MKKPQKHKNYPKAPIVEATIQINFELKKLPKGKEESSIAVWTRALKPIRERYPQSSDLATHTQELTLGATGGLTIRQDKIGFRLDNPSTGYVVQLRNEPLMAGEATAGVLAVSRLAPYESWEPFLAEMKSVWEHVVKTKRVANITRVSTRYINRIDVESTKAIELGEIFQICPKIPNGLDAQVVHFNSQINLKLPDDMLCIVRQSPSDSPHPDKRGLLFDIDVQYQGKIPSEQGIWPILENLRNAKNRVFEFGFTPAQKKKFSK